MSNISKRKKKSIAKFKVEKQMESLDCTQTTDNVIKYTTQDYQLIKG